MPHRSSTTASALPRAAAGQLVAGGGVEVVFVSGDGSGFIKWYQLLNNGWVGNDLLDVKVDHGHSLEIADVNLDGHPDIFSAEMRLNDGNSNAKIRIWLGDSNGGFILHEVATGFGNHESRLGDLDGDGDLDILGKPYNWETPRLDIWINELSCEQSLNDWQRHAIDTSRPERAVYVLPADLDGDGLQDVASGAWWYRNPGSPSGNWQRRVIGSPLNQLATIYDFDGDGDQDILGTVRDGKIQEGDQFVWARNDGSGNFTILDNIQNADGDFLQGVTIAALGNDRPEVALSWHRADKGIQSLTIPADPSNQPWPWQTLSSTSQDEEISQGDIDRDGDVDLLLGTKWLRNDRIADDWWDRAWGYRLPLTADVAGYLRTDKIAETTIDFTTLFGALGEPGQVDLDSLRVVEVDNTDQIIDDAVPFQFDPNEGYDAATNAKGTLIWPLQGLTAAGDQRSYHLYFGTTGQGFTPAAVAPQILVEDGVVDEEADSIRLVTPGGIYYYHKEGGGFSSLLDGDGNDWIGYSTATGSAGEFRGIPNLAPPAVGGHFHPGKVSVTSTIVAQGPLKATIRSTTVDNNWETIWEVYPTYARLTVVQAAADYWFLYEGTPGGELETANDVVVLADGSANLAGESWSGDLPQPEWLLVGDQTLDRALFFVHEQDDGELDSYRPKDDLMTILGFGRDGNDAFLSQTPNHFALGFVETVSAVVAAPTIDAAYRPLAITLGTPEEPGPAPTGDWTTMTLHDGAGDPDRNRLVDVNNDGRLDAVIGYEAISKAGKLAWYAQGNQVDALWTENIISESVVGPMSLDVADMDSDGDLDVVVGEHNLNNSTTARMLILENVDGAGGVWNEHVVYTGDEHHDGAQVIDIDDDGDLDILSIGWGHDDVVLYENRSQVCNIVRPTATPTPSAGTPDPSTPIPTATFTPIPTATNTPAPGSCAPIPNNIIANPGFETGNTDWSYHSNGRASFATSGDAYQCTSAAKLTIKESGSNVQVYQTSVVVEPNTAYILRFAAKSNTGHDMSVYLHKHTSGSKNYGLAGVEVDLSAQWQQFELPFTSATETGDDGRLRFWLAPYDAAGDEYWLDDVQLVHADQDTPTATPMLTETIVPTATSTSTPEPTSPNELTATFTPTETPVPTATATFTPEPADPDDPTPTFTPTATNTPLSDRVTDGLIAYYPLTTFDGVNSPDQSGYATPLDLAVQVGTISQPAGESCGLTFAAPARMASNSTPIKVVDAVSATGELTIEAWLAAADILQDGPARIVTFSWDAYNRNFTLGQDGGRYAVRLRTSDTGPNGVPDAVTTDVMTTDPQHVVFTHEPNGNETIYVNGSVVYNGARSGIIRGWNSGYGFAFGDEFDGDRSWLGTIFQVALYNRALTAPEVNQNLQAGKCPPTDDATATPTNTPEPAEPTPTFTPEPAPDATDTPTPEPQPTATPTDTPAPTVDQSRAARRQPDRQRRFRERHRQLETQHQRQCHLCRSRRRILQQRRPYRHQQGRLVDPALSESRFPRPQRALPFKFLCPFQQWPRHHALPPPPLGRRLHVLRHQRAGLRSDRPVADLHLRLRLYRHRRRRRPSSLLVPPLRPGRRCVLVR